jgi:hypothetical protein
LKPKEEEPLILRIAKALLCLFAMGALSMGVGYVTSAWRVSNSESRQTGANYPIPPARQQELLERPFAKNAFQSQLDAPSPLERSVLPGAGFTQLGSIKNGKLNGAPYEVYSLSVEGTPREVLESYRRNWRYRGYATHQSGDGSRGELVGVRKNNGKVLKVAAQRSGGSDRKTMVNFTSYGPSRHVGSYYPDRLPDPLWPEGLRVTESEEGSLKLTHVTWASPRSERTVLFYLLREMADKGWKPYLGLPDALPNIEDRQFYDDRGGECTVIVTPGLQTGTSKVDITAMWPL